MDSNQRSQKVTDNNAISQNPNVDLQPELEEITHNNVTTLNLNVDLHPGSEQNSSDIDITHTHTQKWKICTRHQKRSLMIVQRFSRAGPRGRARE